VVATRTGGTAEIVADEQTGLLFPPGDASQLAARVRRILGNPDFGRTLGTRARQRVERQFNLEQHLTNMFEFYRAAVSLRLRCTSQGCGSPRAITSISLSAATDAP